MSNQNSVIVQQQAAQMPWANDHVLLDRTTAGNIREFYLLQAVKNAWNGNDVLQQIISQLLLRYGKAFALPKMI